jgi:hypothetical protein
MIISNSQTKGKGLLNKTPLKPLAEGPKHIKHKPSLGDDSTINKK